MPDKVMCPTGRCGVVQAYITNLNVYCGRCMARVGDVSSVLDSSTLPRSNPNSDLAFVPQYVYDVRDGADIANSAFALPPAPEPPSTLDLITRIHDLCHELAERMK